LIVKILLKSIIVSFIAFTVLSYLFVNPVYGASNTGGFGIGTKILTSNGNVPIEELHSGDTIVGYNFSTQQTKENLVLNINRQTSLSYFLINNKTKVSGTYLIYAAATSTRPKILRVQQLQKNNRLIASNQNANFVEQTKQIIDPSELLYQLTLENPEGSFYANGILFYSGSKIPTLFKNNSINCEPGTPYFKSCANLNSNTLPGVIKAIAIIFSGILLVEKTIDKIINLIDKN